jgi:hypothetical protein
MRWAVVAVAVALLAVSSASGSQARAVKPAGLTWSGTHFRDVPAFRSWLGRHGIRYRDWAGRHPRGVYLLTHATPARHAPRPVHAASHTALAAPQLPPSRSHGLFLVFLVLGTALVAIGAFGKRLARAAQLPFELEQVAIARSGMAAGGAALAVGAALAWWL